MAKLLIVDDETDIREFSRNFFQKRNIDVFTASNGREALDIISTQHPDLVLLDVRMDEPNGVELLRILRSGNDTTRVIIISGMEDQRIIDEAKSFGILEFIHKPLVLEELEKIVMTQLEQSPAAPQSL